MPVHLARIPAPHLAQSFVCDAGAVWQAHATRQLLQSRLRGTLIEYLTENVQDHNCRLTSRTV